MWLIQPTQEDHCKLKSNSKANVDGQVPKFRGNFLPSSGWYYISIGIFSWRYLIWSLAILPRHEWLWCRFHDHERCRRYGDWQWLCLQGCETSAKTMRHVKDSAKKTGQVNHGAVSTRNVNHGVVNMRNVDDGAANSGHVDNGSVPTRYADNGAMTTRQVHDGAV